MKVVPNLLESDRFAVRFARLEADGPDDLARALAAADADGVDVTSARADATDLPSVRRLEEAGFRLMDTLVYHARALTPDDGAASDPRVFDLEPNDADACADVARTAFRTYHGHYHADPRLSDDAAAEAYADWAARLVREPADGRLVLGARDGGSVAGFLAGVPRGDGSSEIILNAVRPDAQRTGLYGAMLRAFLARAAERGDERVMISTQLQNYAVQRAWARAGFILYQSFHTLHRWRPTG